MDSHSSQMMAAQQAEKQQEEIIAQLTSGPAPWPPIYWSLGGRPQADIDVPITAVLLVFYLAGAVTNVTLFRRNKGRGHNFIFSMLLFGFCMARTVTCILRIAWSTHESNIRLGIAAQIFVAAGVLIIYIINLFFTQRILRARHPSIGWHRGIKIAFIVFFALVFVCLAMVITVTVQQFYTQSVHTHHIDRDVQLAVSAYFLLVAILPFFVCIFALVFPRPAEPIDKFGEARHRHQIAIVMVVSLVISLGAAYRFGTACLNPVPVWEPLPSYFHRVRFYVFDFVVEIIVLWFLILTRMDKRFHIPDGAHGPGSYSAGAKKPQNSEDDVEMATA